MKMRRKTRGQQAVAIAAAAVGLLRPHDVSGAQHVAFIQSSSSSTIKAANGHHRPREYSSPLDYSKGREEDDVKIWLPTDHIASLGSDTASPINSHGWENFDTQQADDNYNVIDDWIDAKKRRSRRLQSLDDVNSENDKKSNYRAREQKKVNEWRKSRSQTKTTPPTQSLPQPKIIDNAATTSNRNDNNIHRLNLSYTDRSQLSAIQSNAPAILLPSGPGTGKSHVLSLRVAHLLQKWVRHWQHKVVSNPDNNFHRGANGGGDIIEEEEERGGEEEVCSPDSMIILSFTNNDASRLKERALDYLYPTTTITDDNNIMMMMMKRNQTSKALWSGTMHAFSLAILNKYTSSSTPPLRVLPAREMKNRVASSLRSLLDGEPNNSDSSNNDSNVQTEGWYRELQLRHLQTLNDVGHSRSILFQNIVRCIDLWKEANMPLASADHHFIVEKGGGNGGNSVKDGEEEGVRNDCLELAMRLGIPKSSALLALDVFPEYQARHAAAGTVDPSDLAGMAYRYLLQNPESLHLLRSTLKHIIVDEYQDMSVSQHALLRLVVRGVVGDEEDLATTSSNSESNGMKRTKLPVLLDTMDHSNNNGYMAPEKASYSVPSLFCAGDSSQSIYGWRGAAPLLTVDGFRKDFPQGIVAPLDVCYRLPTDILDAANMLLPSDASHRYKTAFSSQASKSFDVSPAAAAKLASNVMSTSSPPPSDRVHRKGNALLGNELLLSKGMQKLDSTVLIHGLWDDREEAKYIASTIRRRSKERRKALLKALKNLDDNISVAQERELLDFTDVAVMVRSSKQMNLLEEALANAGIPFTAVIKKDDEDTTTPIVRPGSKVKMVPMKPVTIMTMHKAKGEEFDDIYLAGWTEGEFPHPDAMSSNRLHEERRLAYVALTRARQRVVITHSSISRKLSFSKDGAKRYVTSQVEPSRFLYELVPSKKHLDGVATKNEVHSVDNVGTFWDRSAGVKDYVAGRNVPQWFQEAYKQPTGYVSRREDVRPYTKVLEQAVSQTTKPVEKASPTIFHGEKEISDVGTDDRSADYSSMTVSQLKQILRSKGLKVGGRKAVLIERLESVASSTTESSSNSAVDYSLKTVSQLKQLLRRKGLKVSGTKAVLIERLKSNIPPVETSLLGYLSMTVVQLKAFLRSKGLKVSGKKAELVERISSYLRT